MSFDNTGIVFLQDTDFKNETLSGKLSAKKVFVMVQGSFCGYCTTAKPDFIKAKNQSNGSVVFATILIDGDSSEKSLAKQLSKITKTDMGGVPAYLLFNNGKFISIYTGGRDVKSILQFINNN